MTKSLEQVREALELYASDATWGKDDWGVLSVNVREYGMPGREAHAALDALQAHEAEVKELVEALGGLLKEAEWIYAEKYYATPARHKYNIHFNAARAILAKVKP
jgi:hypothetical protein